MQEDLLEDKLKLIIVLQDPAIFVSFADMEDIWII